MRELLRRIYYLLNRRKFDAELADEMAFHREMANKAGGIPLGNVLQLREESREAWGFMWLDRLGQDLRYAFRTLRASPGFTASAILVLSVGIGATVAAFSAFNMTLRPLPVRDPDTLVRLKRVSPQQASTEIPYAAVVFYREHARTVSALLAQTSAAVNVEGREESVSARFVSANFFSELGGSPAHGRLFNASDAASDASPGIVLGYAFWAAHFASDPSVVGKPMRVGGKSATIIGVASRDFPGLAAEEPELWLPLEQHGYFVHGSKILTDFSGRSESGVRVWGRLRQGSSASVAEDELTALSAELRRQRPESVFEGERVKTEPGATLQLLGAGEVFALVSVLALLVLLSACGNLGSLILARGAFRQREMALRSAIGAGTGRLIRQLFTESLALAFVGCAGGLVLGWVVLRSLLAWSAAPAWLDPTPDWRVVAFAIAIGVLSSVFFGLAPARLIARRSLLRPRRTFTRTFLIATQVASSCVLLIVGGLLVRAFERVVSTDPGFEHERVVVVEPSLLEHGYTPDAARSYIQDLSQRLMAVPGVSHVSITTTPPLGGFKVISLMKIDGQEFVVHINQGDPNYLTTLGIKLRRGRDLTAADDRSVVISESLALRNWPGQDPIGQSIKVGDEPLTVVGVAANARALALGNPDTAELYRLARAADFPTMAVVARTSVPAETVAPAFRIAANGIDSNFKPRVHLLKDLFLERVGDIQRGAVAVSVLGFVALAVACLGIVGLVAYSVAARTKEIGIRLALGAKPRHVVSSLAGQLTVPIATGLAAGVLGAFGLAQLLRQELYGVSAIDPMAYLGAISVFLLAVSFAALWPARRALRVDPQVALRTD